MRTMKIVLGVCGFGLGHSNRQRPILEGLLARGHDVILVTNDQSHDYFTSMFPQVANARVYVPMIHTTPDGLDFVATADDPRNAQPEAHPAFWNACGLIEQRFGTPDLVISDYDMVSAQIAYLFGAPLVTLDQQSKFLGYACPPIDAFTPQEHRLRLGYFFPKATARVATSFFTVGYAPVAEYPVTVIPPILGHDVKDVLPAPEDGHVTVYISEASHLAQSVDELLALFALFPSHHFTCFVDAEGADVPRNVTLLQNDRPAFVDSLRRSVAVISTAGHNLITEALYLHVPMFLLPFGHYEQQLNTRIVTDEGVGCTAPRVTEANLAAFLGALDGYRLRSHETSRMYDRFDGDSVFLDMVETLLTERNRG
ncbi:MAG: glycosyltransferase family protein [Propionibacteriaceae bacterium]